MSWPFSVLELEAGADAGAIKRAYAARLKKTRPDEDPEGFQFLNDAYRACLALAADDSSSERPVPVTSPTVVFAPATAPEPAMAEAIASAALAQEPPASVPAFDHHDFLERLYRHANQMPPAELARWLATQGDVYSLSEQRALMYHVVDVLEDKPSLTPMALAAVLNHFGLDDGPWVSPLAARAHELRARADADHPGLQTLQFRSTAVARNAPEPANYTWLWVALAMVTLNLGRCMGSG